MLNEYAVSTDKKGIHVTINPKKTEGGNPDFRVWDGTQRIVGYIEAKTPDKNLDDIEKTEQINRYRTTFPNLILTNFFEFRLFKNGIIVHKVRIADSLAIHSLKGTPFVENTEQFENLLKKFFSFSFPSITSAQPLAIELAKRTRFLRDEVIAEELREEKKKSSGKILGFYEAFQTYLIRGLTTKQFADLYSQTITYGLFASRMRGKGKFNRKLAVYDIPRSIGILREMFDFISLGDLPPQLEWIVDEISNVLANVDVKKMFSTFFRTRKGEDPVYHFYETFLAKYDPEEREKRGVYYTPQPVVSYITRSIHLILKEKFGLKDGLANENVTILDPAAGTLTFIAEAIKQAVKEFTSKYGEGGKEELIKEHILKNFYAFELMIAPYAIGHLKISFLLDELGHKLQDEEMKFYLTNTLEIEDIEQTSLPGMTSLAMESRKAGEVKKRMPILIIFGNPPYAINSANKSEFIEKEMELYKEDVRDEKNIQPLSVDYIKFVRFAHWKIEKNKKGIMGYISNNSYSSGIIHRGMRKKLFDTFDEIYVLNLHGSSRFGEKAPEGGKDENIFDIQQGVVIAFYVKLQSPLKKKKVYYADLWGLRDKKYDYLSETDVDITEWKELEPKEPYYFFVPKDFVLQDHYNKFWSLTDVFKESSSGVQTHRDHFVVGFTKSELVARLKVFTNSFSDEEVCKLLNLKDSGKWKVKQVRESVKFKDLKEKSCPYAYRPFDVRWICYEPMLIDRPRLPFMKNLLKENLAIVTKRSRYIRITEFKHAFAIDCLGDKNFLGDQTIVFPLFIHPTLSTKDLSIISNFSFSFLKDLKISYGKEPTPKNIFYYIYAILNAHLYRKNMKI